MKQETNKLFILLAALMVIFALWFGGQQSQAAPPAAPTPVANLTDTGTGRYFPLQTETAIAADTNTSALDVTSFNYLDVQTTIDQGTVNTNTLTVQYSVDGSNWDDGLALVTSNAADATEVTRVPVFGRYVRIKQDLTNTNTITITLLAIGR